MDTRDHQPLSFGCRVCGYGVDWTWYSQGYYAIKTPCFLICLILNWLSYEYVCTDCFVWARKNGAEWDGKLEYGFTSFTSLKSPDHNPEDGGPHDHSKCPRYPLAKSRYAPGSKLSH